MSVVEDLTRDVGAAARNLIRGGVGSRGTTLVAALTLALGIGAATAIFSVVDTVLLRPLPLPGAERLALVWHRSGAGEESWLSWPEIEDLRGETRSFSGIAALRDWSFNLSGPGASLDPEEVAAAAVSADFFRVLAVRPALGRAFSAAEDRPGADRTVLLGWDLWRRRFGGDPAVVGRAVRLNGEPWTVVGVMPQGFRILPPSSVFPSRVDLWVPLRAAVPAALLAGRDIRHLHALGRLRTGVGAEAAQAEVATVARRWRGEDPALYGEPGWELAVVALREQVVGAMRPALLALLAAVALLVVIACANVAHLLLAKNAGRARELAIRAALGASRGRLARLLLAESLLLAALGTAGGIAVAAFGVDLLLILGAASLPRLDEVALDARALAFAAAAGLVTAALFGIAPSLATAGRSARGLREAGRGATPGANAGRAGRARRLLAASEAALALVLLVAGLLMAKSVGRLAGVSPGFAPEGVLTLRVALPPERYPTPERRAAFFDELLARVAALPGVRAAGAVSHLPLSGAQLGSGFAAESGAGTPDFVDADLRGITPGYFRALGIPLLAGRDFGPGDVAVATPGTTGAAPPGIPRAGGTAAAPGPSTRETVALGATGAPGATGEPVAPSAPAGTSSATSVPVAIIDETLARRLWPGEDAVGKRLRWKRSDVPLTVVGVAGGVLHEGPGEAPRETVYRPYAQYAPPFLFLAVKAPSGAAGLAGALRREVRRLDPAQPVADLRLMEERMGEALGRPRFSAVLTGAFAGVALALCLMGLYGVISFAVARRTREIGVRIALGARPGDVLRMVLAEGLGPAIAGVAAGLPLAAAAARALARLLYGLAPLDPAVFAAAPLALGLAAAAACSLPARRAAAVDPVVALAGE